MEVNLRKKGDVWRGRGAPRRQVPPEIAQLAEDTYRTGQCGTATIVTEEDEADARELVNLLTSYARSRGKRLNTQREDEELRFEMVDKVTAAPVQRSKKKVAV